MSTGKDRKLRRKEKLVSSPIDKQVVKDVLKKPRIVQNRIERKPTVRKEDKLLQSFMNDRPNLETLLKAGYVRRDG